jgi:hypothetical protein
MWLGAYVELHALACHAALEDNYMVTVRHPQNTHTHQSHFNVYVYHATAFMDRRTSLVHQRSSGPHPPNPLSPSPFVSFR